MKDTGRYKVIDCAKDIEIMKSVVIALLFCAIVLFGCSKQEDTPKIVNVEKNVQAEDTYMSCNLEIPYDKNTIELDYIGEQCIGLLTNKEGQIEMYTVTHSVMERFRDEAENLIKQKKQLRAEMLECRVWKFSLDEERNWHRESVCKNSFIKEKEIAERNPQIIKYSTSYDREGNLLVFMQYSCQTENGDSSYSIRVYRLEDSSWKTLGECTYTENEDDVQEPINACIDSKDNLIVARMDGSIIKYNFSLNKLVDESDEFKGDLSLSAFSNEYGFSKNNSENEIIRFDTDEFIEEKRLSIPEISKSGPEVIGVNSKDVFYYANSLGIYGENAEETVLEKKFSMDIVSGVVVENMIFNYMGVSDEGDMILHMYDPSNENAQEYIYLIKKVEQQGDK